MKTKHLPGIRKNVARQMLFLLARRRATLPAPEAQRMQRPKI